MEKITAKIKILDWTEGDVYGMRFRLAGDAPAVRIDWGDGCVKTYYGNSIDRTHIYSKGAGHIYVIVATVLSGIVEYVDPTGGDCEFQLIDFSEAPSIREIWAEMTHALIFDNPDLTKLTLRINMAHHYDLSRCPNLTELTISSDNNCPQLDLSRNHKLERLSWGYLGREPRKLIIANDAPLKEVAIEGEEELMPGCLAALHRILERTGGRLIMGADEYVEEE